MADRATEADVLEGLPLPREQEHLFGHDEQARELHEAYRSGRMHHATLLTGPKGVGKATLAFRFARFVLSHPGPSTAPPAGDAPLAPVDPRVAAQVRSGAHPNVLHLRRAWDEKQKKLKTVLSVDEVRRSVSFFGNSAGGAGYRVAIVDAADDMNANAANALLKLLEEPPARALFVVLSHAPGALLPTIRSRCRRLALRPLDADVLMAAVSTFGLPVEEGDKPAVAAVSEGSVRRACELIDADGIGLYHAFRAIVDALPSVDRGALHRFAERAGAGRKGDSGLGLTADLARGHLTERLHGAPGADVARVERLAAAWETIGRIVAETDGLNLDRKQAALQILLSLAETHRK